MIARKPFTMMGALLFLAVAAAHAYRLATGAEVMLGGSAVPMSVSWVGLVVAGLLGVMLLVEARR